MKQKQLIVIGGGAAGFFTAVNAARLDPLLKVIILEKTSKLLSKVKVSGGGRCNVTHACFEIDEMAKRYPRGFHFVRKAFHHFFTTDTIEWFKERGVALKTEADGRMFPDTDQSETIIHCLLKEADKYKVEIRMNADVKKIDVLNDDTGNKNFRIHFANEAVLEADFLCVASGGYPKASQFEWLQQTGHTIIEPAPSLFTFNMPGNTITSLMGMSVANTIVKIKNTKLVEQGPLLVTHWGMSGPVVLRLSAWGARALAQCNYNFTITVNWVPEYTEQSLRNEWALLRQQNAAQKISSRNPFNLPNRLWEYLIEQSGVDAAQRWGDIASKQQNLLIQHLTMQQFEIKGKTTFKEEFVTCGGISLTDVDVNTMQSKKHSGLFFAGEVLDVDGITGGFNFQHAWTSGWVAAKGIVESSKK
ncbi:MAG: NAD(P)/FAD-dependent oxidoreductase [Agriterribacter sp.]